MVPEDLLATGKILRRSVSYEEGAFGGHKLKELSCPDVATAMATVLLSCSRSMVNSNCAPAIAGIDNKNENRAALTRFKPIKRATVMVMPEREVPGISAIV